jgi:hypothetical protein
VGLVRSILPPLIVGAVTVGSAELSLSLLLYSRPGFLRALTVLLGVQLASLAVGLATGPGRGPDGRWTAQAAATLRWRWLLSVIALGVAAFAAGGWSLLGGLGGSPAQRGVAVAALASLPLLTLGGVLGGLAARSPHVRVGAWATAGGAIGAAVLGTVLLTRLLPASMLLGSTILISIGALLDGRHDRALFEDYPDAEPDIPSVGAFAPDGVLPIEFLAPDPPRTSGAVHSSSDVGA